MRIFQSLVQSDFNAPHSNLEAVIREGDKLTYWCRTKSGEKYKWNSGTDVGAMAVVVDSNVAGPGSIIQSDYKSGSYGNFEVIVPLFNANRRRELWHFYHDNSNMSLPWRRGQMITSNVAGGGSIIQSRSGNGTHGNFEVVVPLFTVSGHIELWHFWRDNSSPSRPWHRGLRITGENDVVGGPGSIIQSVYGGTNGNFEVVVPLIVQGDTMELWHFYHDNSALSSPWQRGKLISANATGPGAIIQSDFKIGNYGNFEVVVPEKNSLVHYWRDNSSSSRPWRRGQTITESANGWACLIQSDRENDQHGNFEVLVEECKQSVVNYFRSNQEVSWPWLRRKVLIGEPEPRQLAGTRKIVQLTGEYDREGWRGSEPPAFAHNRTESRFGIRGTDMGVSFDHKGKVYFLFGDTFWVNQTGSAEAALDIIAYSENTSAANGINLTFYEEPPIVCPPDSPNACEPIEQGGFSVPLDGVSVNDRMYVFFSDGSFKIEENIVIKRTVHTRSDDDGRTFRLCYEFSREKFINVSVERGQLDRVTARSLRWPPNTEVLWIWGSGRYRSSDVYLAVMPLSNIETGVDVKYFTGRSGLNPTWSSQESDAVALFCAGCVGELSVRRNPFLNRYLALFNSNNPRGIVMHSAATPYGPWSKEPIRVFNPNDGYCKFMHVSWKDKNCDYVHDDMFNTGYRINDYGGEYGPYQITRYATGEEGQWTQIYFTMSTWNPYQVMLMTARITSDDV